MSIPPSLYPGKFQEDVFVNFCKDDSNSLEELYHFHAQHYEICFVLKGKCEYFFDYKEVNVSQYEMLFLNKKMFHLSEVCAPETERVIINLNDAFLSSIGLNTVFLFKLFSTPVFKIPNKYINDIMRIITKLIFENDYPSVYSKRLTEGYIYEMFVTLYRITEDVACNYLLPTNPIVEAVSKYICQNFSQPLTLEKIAEYCHISKYYLSKLFKKIIGTNLNSYINTIRIHEAEKMLSETDKTILEISQACGYNTLKHFCEVFKKTNGITANEFRSQSKGIYEHK